MKGGRRRVSAVFSSRSRRGRVELIATTAPGHRARRVRPGSRLRSFRAAYPRRRRIARGVYRAGPRSRHVLVVRGGRVRVLAVASPRLKRARLLKDLRLARR